MKRLKSPDAAGFPVVLAGSKSVQVKERVAFTSPLAQKTPSGKAGREILLPPRNSDFPKTGGFSWEKGQYKELKQVA
ncbi:hypothetical protein [Hungatella effluvii]|uniref:hypothetical protein n=1 Tax=Hungatella effluvii TaxID=1096246 RepID=UPI0022E10B6E|nr:hypothetical protein [Hungatella effluvii]